MNSLVELLELSEEPDWLADILRGCSDWLIEDDDFCWWKKPPPPPPPPPPPRSALMSPHGDTRGPQTEATNDEVDDDGGGGEG